MVEDQEVAGRHDRRSCYHPWMIVKPFRGLRPRHDLSAKIPSYPYDVVNREEATELAAGDPYSFLHVVRAEIDLPAEVELYDERVYEKGRENFHAMIEQGWLVRDDEPAYYVYRLRMGDHVQTGIVAAAAVEDYVGGRIKKHELTRPAKEDDRVRVVRTLGAHPGPVFLIYRPVEPLNAIVASVVERESDVGFTAPDGIEHRLWVVADPEVCRTIEEQFAQIDATYVADGHHRAAAAARAAADGSPYFLAVHFPSDEVRVLDYNRAVRDLNGLSPEGFLEQLREAGFEVAPASAERHPTKAGSFGLYLAGSWYLLTPGSLPAELPDRLDVAVLADRVLSPILGIADPRTDARIDFVGGIRGMDELERLVDGGSHALAFALYPTSLDDLMQVADAGQIMPPKSTWFEPKLRSGLVVQLTSDL
jgi:uncharacterized protein (DUF1015 family)